MEKNVPSPVADPISAAPRRSLADFLNEFESRRDETATAHRRGYRMERSTYGEILADARRFARELESRNLSKSDAVLLWGEPSPAWIAAFFGCVLRGAVAVPIDPISTPEFAARVAREVGAKLIVLSRAAALRSSIPALEFESLLDAIAHHSSSTFASPALTRDDTLEIIFTSGTTADPRGVVISHGNILANIEPLEREIRKYLRYERFVHPLRFLNLLPLSHIFGQIMGLFIPPLLAGTVIFVETLKPSELIDTIRRERISVLVSVPRVVESLQREIERGLEAQRGATEKFRRRFASAEGKHFLRRWWIFRNVHRRFGWKFWAVIAGGATLPSSTETFWHRLGYAVIQGYGMTETASLITLNHPFRLGRGSIGEAFPGMEIRLSSGGEILVRGENVAKSYWQGAQLQPVAGEDGWFHTGDLAELGEDGRLYFKGRQKNVIVTPAGMNIHPDDLEQALRRQKGVRDCVVIGVPRDGNEEPCAAFLLDGTASAAAIIDGANRSLAEFQRIRCWFEWPDPDFPRTPAQKPALSRIREAAAARFGASAASSAPSSPTHSSPIADLVARITGRSFDPNSPDAARAALAQMSSLDRVELMSAMEDRYQLDLSEVNFAQASSIEQLEKLVREPQAAPPDYVFPRWPQTRPITAIRLAAYYLLVWPATYLLAAPRVKGRHNLRRCRGPLLVVCNHVTDIDIGWILAALPLRFRHRLATAMGGERLASMRHPPETLGWLARIGQRFNYALVVALFNVFPLPRESAFLRSFSFAGDLVDRGWNILIFPEGATTKDGRIAPFRAGIGLLATRLNIPIVPLRLDGAYGPKQRHRRFARPGEVRVTIGEPVRYASDRDAAEIAADLQRRVESL